ncbi:hypothetical protein FRB96_006126 [Tulasnella sp. 330]|nr:hypothetical protein FRB96_006126 [Tulasnella sp. 330]KAG8887691.1 hypothetical protein FRB98_009201 [Tulasnella sp. 332]
MTTDRDPTTQSNYWEITTKHAHFDWDIDWKSRILSGSVTHTLLSKKDSPAEVMLVRHPITILSYPDVALHSFDTQVLEIKSASVNGSPVRYELRPAHPVMGSAMVIKLESAGAIANGAEVVVKIDYSTTPQCTAIGWLEKEQTAGNKFAFLFSQCEPIHARSLAPLQDSPSVKLTYSASVRSVLPALCSALRISPPCEIIHGGKKVGEDVVEYKYNQPIAIPSYLIALASGNLVFKSFAKLQTEAWTTGVWAEPETIDAAYFEFSKDTASYVATEEKLVTPYEFGVYDLLVLPPAFPYGGMENACLTFLTPTLLTGDRSLVDVVAHESSHSWFGNNVTTADSSHFWLNEGFTTYFERVIIGALHGAPDRDFSYIIGKKALDDALKQVGTPKYQRLVIPFTYGEDPDEAYSRIPYEKGSNFLLYLGEDYVQTFRGKSIRTDDWKRHLFRYFEANGGKEKSDILNAVDWEAWLHGEGLELPVAIKYDTTLAQQAYDLADKWDKSREAKDPSTLNFSGDDLKPLNPNQIMVFIKTLEGLSSPLPATHIRYMSDTYTLFNTTGNAEIRSPWYVLVLASDAASDFLQDASDWVVGKEKHGTGGVKGRMKFCRPIFRAIYEVDASLARDTFTANRQLFHPIAAKLIAKDLGLST